MRKEPNYLYLMVSLLGAVVVVTSTAPQSLIGILGVFAAALTLLVNAYFLVRRRVQLLLAVLLGASAFIPFAWQNVYPSALGPRLANGVYVLNTILWLLFTSYTGVIVFRGIMAARRIRVNEIYGAIYVYLLIGVLFAEIYLLLLAWQPDALFFDPGRFPEPQVLVGSIYTRGAGAVLYYSFVTLGTVGYGDVTPASPLARSLSLIEAVVGIMYVATMIARFVSIQTSVESRGAEPGAAEPPPSRGNLYGAEGAAGEKVEGNK